MVLFEYILMQSTRGFEMADGENPFLLLARITVREGVVNGYLAIAKWPIKPLKRQRKALFS